MTLDGSLERTADGGYVVAFDRIMDRSPEQVWSVLTEPQRLANWLGDVEVDLRIGGAFIIRFRGMAVVMTGTITALEPGRVLEYTWLEKQGSPESVVRWEILPLAAGSRLRLSHRFPAGCAVKDMAGFLGGWHAFLEAIPPAAEGAFVPYADETDLQAAYRERYAALGA